MSEQIKINAICTRVVDYRDNDRLLELCSFELGKISAIARGAKKPKAKLKYATMLFSFGEYTVIEKSGKYILCDCNQIDSFSGVTEDLDKFYIGVAMLEVLSKALQNGTNENATLYTVHGLKKLCYSDAKSIAAFNWYLLQILATLGYRLDFSKCTGCCKNIEEDAIFTEDGGVQCEKCGADKNGLKISKLVRVILKNPLVEKEEIFSKTANTILREILDLLAGIKIKTKLD